MEKTELKMNETPIHIRLTAQNDDIRSERGNRLVERLERIKRAKIEQLEEEIAKKEDKLDVIYDFGPKQTTDLAYQENSLEELVDESNALVEEIYLLKERVKALIADYRKLFINE